MDRPAPVAACRCRPLRVAAVICLVGIPATAPRAPGHGHGGGASAWRAQQIKDANSWRDGFRGPHDFGGGVTIPQDRGLNTGLGGGLDGRGFAAAATPLDGGGRLDGSDWSLDGGATQGYRSGRFAGSVDPTPPAAKPATAKPATAKPATAKPATAKPAAAEPAAAKPVAGSKAP